MDFLQKFKILIISILLLALTACGEGCIEPEDFGGYNTQIINVSADGINYEECSWSMDDSGSVNLGLDLNSTDLLGSNDIVFLKSLGCAYDNVKYDDVTKDKDGQTINIFSNAERRRCFIEAEKLCKNRKLAIADGSYAGWGAVTDKEENGGVRLSRNNKIFIKAKGDINYGAKDEIFAKLGGAESHLGHSLDEKSKPFLYDVSGGDTKQITIVGRINGNQGSPSTSDISNPNWLSNAHKGFSQLYAYIKKFPPNYLADNSETDSENERAIGDYPIDPDPRLWHCFPSGNGGEEFKLIDTYNNIDKSNLVTNCYSLNYKKNYTKLRKRNINVTNNEVENPETSLISKVNDTIFAEKYQISEYDITDPRNLGKYGGAILHNKLGDILLDKVTKIKSDVRKITAEDSYRLVEYNNDNCSITVNAKTSTPIKQNNNKHSIILYPNQSLTIKNKTIKNCTDVSYQYIRDITLKESGYVRFFNQDGPCKLKISIANKKITDNGKNDYKVQYILDKELPPIDVNKKPIDAKSIREFLDSTGNVTYIRKGQILLFLPDSWKWNDNNNGCNINTLMHIEHRPAVICKDFQNHKAVNMACSYNYKTDDKENIIPSCSGQKIDPYIENMQYECIDFTDYKDNSSKIKSYNNLLKLAKDVKQIPFFGQDLKYNNGSAGNFTAIYNDVDGRLKNIVGNHLALNGKTNDNGLHELSSKNSVVFTESGRLKFLFLDDFDSLYSRKPTANPLPSQLNEKFKIKLGYYDKFSNGENLQMVLCNDNAASGNCNSSNPLQKIIIKDDKSYNNQYAFSIAGTFKDISSSERKDYYMHNGSFIANPDDDKNLLLAFNIHNPNVKDSIEKNCLISDPDINCKDICQQGAADCKECDGVLIGNPYYQNQYCNHGSSLLQNDGATICCSNDFVYNDENQDVDELVQCQNANKSSNILSSPDDICSFLSPSCHHGKICVGPYYDIEGSYQVTVKIPNVKGIDSRGIISGIIVPFSDFMLGTDEKTGFIERSYKKIVQNDLFIQLIQLFSILFITFFGIAYFMGVADMKQEELMMRILKLGIIYLLISPNSWGWYKMFFVDVFTDGISYIVFLMSSTFDRDPEILNAINNNDFSDKALLFKSSDKIFRILFDDTIHKKILAIIFSNFFGIIYVIVIYWAIGYYLLAFFTFIVLFLTAQSFIHIFLIFGPIFIILMLFSKTSRYFHSWYEQMLGLGLQQALMVLFLSFFNGIIYELIMLNFNYKVCWGSVWSLPIPGFGDIFDFWTLPSSIGINPNGSEINSAPQLMAILFIFFICRMMYDFIEFIQNLGSTIVGNLNVTVLSQDMVSNQVKQFRAIIKYSKNSLVEKTGIGELYENRKDAFLDKHFDHGKIADKKYKEQQKKKKIMEAKRSTLRKAGDKSDAQYLKDHNIKNSSKLSPEQKLQMQRRRKDAIEDKANNMGIDVNGKEFKQLTTVRAGQFESDQDRKEIAEEQLQKEGVDVNSKEGKKRVQEMVEASRNRDENNPLKAAYVALQNKLGYNADRRYLPLPTSRNAMESKYYNNQEDNAVLDPALKEGDKDFDPTLKKGDDSENIAEEGTVNPDPPSLSTNRNTSHNF
jgi:type IV secretory pathway VirB6-like protein